MAKITIGYLSKEPESRWVSPKSKICILSPMANFDRTLRNVKVKGCKSQKDRAEENLHNTFEKGDKISMIIILAYCVRRQCNITPRT